MRFTSETGLLPVEPLHPPLIAVHQRLYELKQRVRQSEGAVQARERAVASLNRCLYELKKIVLIAFRYREQHDFYNLVAAWPNSPCPPHATTEQRFQYDNNLVVSGLRLEIESYHLWVSILLDRLVRLFPVFFEGATISATTHDKFWATAKKQQHVVPLIPETVRLEAEWLQEEMDTYRNRVITHAEGLERDGFHRHGVYNRTGENARIFVATSDEPDKIRKESRTLEEITSHLTAYVTGLADVLEANLHLSVVTLKQQP